MKGVVKKQKVDNAVELTHEEEMKILVLLKTKFPRKVSTTEYVQLVTAANKTKFVAGTNTDKIVDFKCIVDDTINVFCEHIWSMFCRKQCVDYTPIFKIKDGSFSVDCGNPPSIKTQQGPRSEWRRWCLTVRIIDPEVLAKVYKTMIAWSKRRKEMIENLGK